VPLAALLEATSREELRALAERGHRERDEAARRWPPVYIDDGVPRPVMPPGAVLRGHATFGVARGPAFLLDRPERAPSGLPAGAVLVLPAMLPSLTYLLPGAAALVTDHGGATSHGATLAREYGVPAVLGVGRATSELGHGAEVLVDGGAGKVYQL
jgi:pyruvate,water dikinase